MSTVKTDSVIGSFLPIPVIEHATDSEVYTATAGQTVFTTTKFDRSNAIRVIAKSSGGVFSDVPASWTGANTVTITGTILGAGQIVYIFKVGTQAGRVRVQDANGAWVDLSTYSQTLAQKGANSDITSLSGLTTPLSVGQGGTGGSTQLAARDGILAAPQSQGFIEGLTLTWTSATAVAIAAGSAYVSSVSKVVNYAGGTITPSGSANAFIHLYLTSAGAIEQSSTDPVRYYNQAFNKTGDTSRRYIGSLLVSTTANQVYKFHHHPGNGSMMYTHGNPGVVPFRVLNNVTGTGSFTTSPCCPLTSYSLIGSFQSIGASGIVQFTPTDSPTAVASGWEVFVSAAIVTNAACRIADDRTIAYYTSSTNTASCYCTGYYFDR